jgi:hypothetical protein
MAESAFKRTFKIKAFTGEDDEWRIWSSRCWRMHQERILRHTTTVQDLTVVAVAEKDKEARSDLDIACDGEAWELIHDMDPANQTAHNMWMALKNTFEPVEIDDYIDLSN